MSASGHNGAPSAMRTPRGLDLEITSRCNLRCRYCYYFENDSVTYADLPGGEWQKFFDELERCGVMRVTLQGGEPLMRSDFRELIEGVVVHRMRFAVLTNGTLVTDELAGFMAGTGRCDQVQVSIDGSCPEVHDMMRGAGSFEKAVRGIRILRAAGVPVGVRVTITRHNVDDLERTAGLLLDELGLPGFGTNAAGYMGTCRRYAEDMMLDSAARARAMKVLSALSRKYPGRITATAGPLADAVMWRRMEKARREKSPPFPEGGHLTGCGCYFSNLAVRADGVMVPCVLLAHMELGRINRDALADVWLNHPILRELRHRSSLALQSFDYCKECPYVPYCTGNCPALSYTVLGEVNHPSPDGCLRRFLEDGGRLEDLP